MDQELVTPKTNESGGIIPPTNGQIIDALNRSPMKFKVDYSDTLDDTDSASESENGGRLRVYNDDFIVSDFQPGRNTFIDATTGKVRFIDPRIILNDPDEGYSLNGKRRTYKGGLDLTEGNKEEIDSQHESDESPEDYDRYQDEIKAHEAENGKNLGIR